MPLRVRTIYFKSKNPEEAAKFWQAFLGLAPHKTFEDWYEFKLDNINLAIGKDAKVFHASGMVPVFECKKNDLAAWIEKAQTAGAKLIFDETKNPEILSAGFTSPAGHDFEISLWHDE